MTDRIDKLLLKIQKKQRLQLIAIVERIVRRDLTGLDVKKLQGRENVFRARKGDFRVIFLMEDESILILAIERRNEKTYH